MKKMSFEQMENVNGGQSVTTAIDDSSQSDDISVACVASIAATALFFAGLFAIPVGGYALALYAANAILGPTIAGVGIGTSCL